MPDHRRKGVRRLFRHRLTWKYFLRGFGLLGACWELFVDHADRPDILLLLAGCLGLPEFLQRKDSEDERRGE